MKIKISQTNAYKSIKKKLNQLVANMVIGRMSSSIR